MADFVGVNDGRRMAVRWSRAPAGGTSEDQVQISMHFVKIAAGVPANWVNGTDDATVETAFGTLWGTLKSSYPNYVHLDVFRWYVSNGVFDVQPPTPYNPAYRTTEVDVAGTFSSGAVLPPQTAWTTTFKTSVRKRWGRVYMPAPLASNADFTGRMASGVPAGFATAWQTFLNACTTAHIQPTVMSKAHDAYTTDKGRPVAAQVYTHYSIQSVQVDDLWDVIRSRRYSSPTVRSALAVTAAT